MEFPNTFHLAFPNVLPPLLEKAIKFTETNIQHKNSLHVFSSSSFKPVLALLLEDKPNNREHYLAEFDLDSIKGIQRTLQCWFDKTDFQASILPIFFSTTPYIQYYAALVSDAWLPLRLASYITKYICQD